MFVYLDILSAFPQPWLFAREIEIVTYNVNDNDSNSHHLQRAWYMPDSALSIPINYPLKYYGQCKLPQGCWLVISRVLRLR